MSNVLRRRGEIFLVEATIFLKVLKQTTKKSGRIAGLQADIDFLKTLIVTLIKSRILKDVASFFVCVGC
jgi:hypothetical protein